MRYLVVLGLILISTVLFTSAGKKYKCGPIVKKHNCECKAKSAGQLKLEDGKLLMCDGSEYKPLQFEMPTPKNSRANPAYSCKEIMEEDAAADDGIYWLTFKSDPSVFPVYCDMSNGGWTMIFKAVSGAKESAFNTFNSGETLAENDMSALDVTNQHLGDYKSRIILKWAEFAASEAKVVLYEDGSAVKKLFFDATGTDKLNWFSKDKLKEPLPWENVKSEEQNSFSIQGLTNRNFFINRNYGGCHVDSGWLCITSTPCEWEKRYGVNAVLYSTLATHTNWNTEANVAKADVLAVFLR
nr:uncharacterized protein LOC131786567 [Pocillopora verrucosa]